MRAEKYNTLPLANFAVNSSIRVDDKLGRLKQAGPEHIHYLFDFDRTLTTSAHIGKDQTVWDIIDRLVPDESRKLYDVQSKRYQDMEVAGKLSEKDALDWWALSFELYIQHGIKLDEIREALGKLQIRDGAIELFASIDSAGVPAIILSAGIGDVIKIITAEHGMHPTAILSTKLHFAPDGRLTGWDPESLTHILNKHDIGHPELSILQQKRPYTVLIGDSCSDARMVKGDEDVLRIRVGDRHWDNKSKWDEYVQASFDAGFDLVVMPEDLLPILALTRWMLEADEE